MKLFEWMDQKLLGDEKYLVLYRNVDNCKTIAHGSSTKFFAKYLKCVAKKVGIKSDIFRISVWPHIQTSKKKSSDGL